MNNEVQSKWIKALRSDKYKQGTDQLKTDSTFCCLGVLCDIYLKEHGKEWGNKSRIYPELSILPMDVQRWAGLAWADPLIRDHSGFDTPISTLNDEEMLSFSKIADLIEGQL